MSYLVFDEADKMTALHNITAGIAGGTHNGITDNKNIFGGYAAPIFTGGALSLMGAPVAIPAALLGVALAKIFGNQISISMSGKNTRDALDKEYFDDLYKITPGIKNKLSTWCSKVKGSGPFKINGAPKLGHKDADNFGIETSSDIVAQNHTHLANSHAYKNLKKDLGTAITYIKVPAKNGGSYIVFFEFDTSSIKTAKVLVFKGNIDDPNQYAVVSLPQWKSIRPEEYTKKNRISIYK